MSGLPCSGRVVLLSFPCAFSIQRCPWQHRRVARGIPPWHRVFPVLQAWALLSLAAEGPSAQRSAGLQQCSWAAGWFAVVLLLCLELCRKSLRAAPHRVCVSSAVQSSTNPAQELLAEDCLGRGGGGFLLFVGSVC